MNRNEVIDIVLPEYAKIYPLWTDVQVTEVVLDTFGGNLAVVRGLLENGHENEEICFVYPEGTVKIFRSTEELATFLEQKAKASFLERFFTRPILSGVIFAFLLVAVFIIGFTSSFKPEALSILGSVVGVAAGFFFGSKSGK
jgi:uncharacterized membrane protein